MRSASVIIAAMFLAVMLPGPELSAAGGPSTRPATHTGHDAKGDDTDDSPSVAGAGPHQIGDNDPSFWGPLTEDQQADAIGRLKKFARKSADQLRHPLHLSESKCFLLYSDVSENDASRYSTLLERMHGKLVEMFGVEKTQNVFRGKALVFIFARVEDYRLFERLSENTDPGGSFGMTHCFGDGMVHMAFYRYPSDSQFSHLLVHETVHGFLHRYRSPTYVPSWVNEGIADDLASELVPNRHRNRQTQGLVKAGLAQHNNALGDFFTARQIDGWQYPIAETLCAWMIRHNSRGYLDFINGIKDGQTCEASLKKNFDMTPDQMLAEYAKSMGLKTIRR